MVLAGIGSLTPQSMLGAIAGTAVSGLSVGGALLLLNALRERTGTLVVTELRGVGLEVPRMAALLMLGAAGAGALPGCAGFWTTWLLALGAIVREPGIAVALLVAAVLLAASQMVPMLRVLRGRLPESLRQGSALLAYGGHVPELRPREILTTMPIVVLVVLLGLYPSPLVKRAQAAARDLNELVSPPGPDHVE
jgi:NADH-quinone oxidoreductase subunit M